MWTTENTTLETWFERDRRYIGLCDKSKDPTTNNTIVEWWDDDVTQLVEDGFLDPKRWHESAVEYANQHSLTSSSQNPKDTEEVGTCLYCEEDNPRYPNSMFCSDECEENSAPLTETVTRTKRPLYREIASLLQAIENCKKSENWEWEKKHTERLENLTSDLPRGNGFNSGTKIVHEDCKADKLVFETLFHHMNDGGYYDGWTHHRVIVTPSFNGIDIRVTGRNRNDIKDYIHEMFYLALTAEIEIV